MLPGSLNVSVCKQFSGIFSESERNTGRAEQAGGACCRIGAPLRVVLESPGSSLFLSSFPRTINRNCSYTSLGHFSFPICFSTFLSLSRSSCSPSPAISTGRGWKQGSNRSNRVNHSLMCSVPGVAYQVSACINSYRVVSRAGFAMALTHAQMPWPLKA